MLNSSFLQIVFYSLRYVIIHEGLTADLLPFHSCRGCLLQALYCHCSPENSDRFESHSFSDDQVLFSQLLYFCFKYISFLFYTYLCFQIILPTMHLRDFSQVMRNCCSQVSSRTVTNQHDSCDINSVVFSSVEEANSYIVAVIKLDWISILRSLPVTKRK